MWERDLELQLELEMLRSERQLAGPKGLDIPRLQHPASAILPLLILFREGREGDGGSPSTSTTHPRHRHLALPSCSACRISGHVYVPCMYVHAKPHDGSLATLSALPPSHGWAESAARICMYACVPPPLPPQFSQERWKRWKERNTTCRMRGDH